jgi:hypothetical protein
MAVTEHDAQRMDIDPAFRAKFIKSHGYEQYKIADAHAYDPNLPPDLQTPEGKNFLDHGMAASYLDGRGLIMLSNLPCKGHPGYIARLDPDEGDVLYGCSESFLPKEPFEITWSDGGQGAFAAKEFVPTDLGVKYLAKENTAK